MGVHDRGRGLILYRDVRRTLVRFDVLNTIPTITPADAACFEAAKEVFASDPETFIFIYGHTHNALSPASHSATHWKIYRR